MSESPRPSLYETLYGNFTGGIDLYQVSEQNQTIISVLDNMQRILNCRAGTLAHLPDYGLPDMTKILLEQTIPGELRYAIDAELRGIGLVRYGTAFMPEGRVLIRYLKQQQYLDAQTHL